MPITHRLVLRKLRPEDREIIREWANDPDTRRNSFQGRFIRQKAHATWFQSILDRPDKNKAFLCWEADRRRVGTVRFSRIHSNGKRWEIHFSVSPHMRGKGLAGPMIHKALERMRGIIPRAAFVARVKRQNHKSLRVLKSLGFQAATWKSTPRGGVGLILRGPLPASFIQKKLKSPAQKADEWCR